MGRSAQLVGAAQWALIGLVAYDTVLAAAGWPRPRTPRGGRADQRFRVLVAAHDEQHVVGALVQDVRQQDHPPDCVRVVVLADRCTDGTAAVARSAGAEVVERTAGPEGKGAAIAWYLGEEPLHPDEAVVILDADTRVPQDLLSGFAAALDEGHDVLQANLDVSNPDASILALASALSYWSGNRMVQQARTRLGWSADLGGTGMCLTERALREAGGFSSAFAEDRDLALRVLLSGRRVHWLHTVSIYDEKPSSARVAVRQRARWRNADRQVRRRHLLALLRFGAVHRSPSAFDHALRMVRPGRSVLVALSVPSAGAAAVASRLQLLPLPVWAATLTAQLLLPPVFLARDGVAWRHVVRYPAAILVSALALPVQVAAPRVRGWAHTPHVGSLRDESR